MESSTVQLRSVPERLGRGSQLEVDAESIRTDTLDFRLRSDGILHGVARPDRVQSLEDARENLAAANRLTGETRVPFLLDIRSTGTLCREARELYAGEAGARTITALAFVADSAFTRVVGNLFIRLARTRFPVRLFGSESDATRWLQEFRQ